MASGHPLSPEEGDGHCMDERYRVTHHIVL